MTTCPVLTSLTISGCDLEGMDDPATAEATLMAMADLHHLTRLILREDPHDVGRCLSATTTTHNPAWPHLQDIWLHDCPNITDTQTIAFIKTHPNLLSLTLIGGHLTDATLDAITTHLPQIQSIGLIFNVEITERGVRRLAQRCRELKEIRLFGCGILGDDFPEAGEHCWETEDDSERDDDGFLFLEYLDEQAINTIQLLHDEDDDDNEDDDSGD